MEKKYDHLVAEKQAQDFWASENVYTAENNPGQLYSIDTPPPTVSGALHIGHIFSYTQTDIIARYKRMSGYSVFYPFGFDDNGLPTERFVEKKLQVSPYQMTRSAFIELCLKETHSVEDQFKQLWQRIGLSVDWSACYSTIDENTRRISQKSFIELYKKEYVYRKDEPALYCTSCRTSVAQAELDDVELPAVFYDVAFKDHHNNNLVISTTRPELIGSAVALLYNPNDSRYQKLAGTKARVPVFNYEIPILADEQVKIDKGTGLVMFATFGDKTDIDWFKKFSKIVSYRPSFGRDGRFLESTGPLAGLKAKPAREKIVELLAQENLLLGQKQIVHAVNVHERCKTPIDYLMLPQWFLKILPYKQKFIELGEEINWYPSFMKARYKNWVENLNWDWGLSRQRFFGIPFPVWYCADCETVILADEKQLPVDPQETKPAQCPHCKSKNIVPDTDVMDTWNTSSLTPYICRELASDKKNFLPMSMRPQAHDIIRTWAFYTIVKSWMHNALIPWRDIVISGHVLSSEKEKISKSKENSPLVPENLLKLYPADAIRYWTASAGLGYDVAFSENQLKIGQKLLVKLWNACKFIQEHGAHNSTINNRGLLNNWILDKASFCYHQYKHYFEQHELNLALDTVEKFFWHDFCDNYLELIKDQLFNPGNYSPEEVAATKDTLHALGLRILQLYAPFIPHITEIIYSFLYKNNLKINSLHRTKFDLLHAAVQLPDQARETNNTIELLLTVVQEVRKLKTEQQLSLKTPLIELIISSDKNKLDKIRVQENLLKGITGALKISYTIESQASRLEKLGENSWQAVVVV